jgi:hypothetical protein
LTEKEYVLKCECGAKYLYQGEKDDLEKFLDSPIWMCDSGRHVELGKKGDYLEIIEERDQLTKRTEVEPKKQNEYTVPELQEKFGTSLEHVGFGVFKDPNGNVWDYRLSEKGERLYSKIG